MAELIRLQKFLADNGVASRRKSEELISMCRVTVNGRVASLGDKINPETDKILLDGKEIIAQKSREYVYIMLNKPRGYVSTMSDEKGRKCVASLVEDVGTRVFPVGRLDLNSEGLLLFTNDGEFSNNMMHPSKHISKIYRVTVRGNISEEQLTSLSESIMIDGKRTIPARINVLLAEQERTVMEITLYEGRNRQIRRICENAELEVIRLKRTSIGGVKLGMLKTGKWRYLTSAEIASLKNQVKIRG